MAPKRAQPAEQAELIATEPDQRTPAAAPAKRTRKASPAAATDPQALAPQAAAKSKRAAKAKVATDAVPMALFAAEQASEAAPAPLSGSPPEAPAEPSAEVVAPQQSAPQTSPPSTTVARYPRRVGPADPPPRRPPPAPIARTIGPSTRTDDAPGGPRAVDMAELAERQRLARDRARQSDRDDDGSARTVRPAALNMQERALRFRGARPDAEAAAPAAAARPLIPAHSAGAPAAERHPVDGQARALEVSRHKRDADEPLRPLQPMDSAPTHAHGGVVIALVTRNDQARVATALAAWRKKLPEPDLRWAVVDLGSTDDTVATIEDVPGIKVILQPGGLVDPAATVCAALRQITADSLLLIDVRAEPDSVAEALLRALRAGAALAIAPRVHPTLIAVARHAWVRDGERDVRDWSAWARRHGEIARFGAESGPQLPASLIARLLAPAQEPSGLARVLPATVHKLWKGLRAFAG